MKEGCGCCSCDGFAIGGFYELPDDFNDRRMSLLLAKRAARASTSNAVVEGSGMTARDNTPSLSVNVHS